MFNYKLMLFVSPALMVKLVFSINKARTLAFTREAAYMSMNPADHSVLDLGGLITDYYHG